MNNTKIASLIAPRPQSISNCVRSARNSLNDGLSFFDQMNHD